MIGAGVYMFVDKKKFESYFSDQLAFSLNSCNEDDEHLIELQ